MFLNIMTVKTFLEIFLILWTKKKILKKFSSLNATKAYQQSHIPKKLSKEVLTFFQKFFVCLLILS